MRFIPGYHKHGRRPCELKMQRKCYVAEAFTLSSINILAHAAEKEQTDQFALQNCHKNMISKIETFFQTQKLHQPSAALPPAGVTAGNGNNGGQVLLDQERQPQKHNLYTHINIHKKQSIGRR